MIHQVIKVENLSKRYQIGELGTGNLSWDIERWVAKLRRKPDPFLKIEESIGLVSKNKNDTIWSLKEVSFDLFQGDIVGVIGKNGAGKSTLLKILSKVTSPTKGKISGIGRVASLLEVGTGFHPELTGRENIFLNGAILGMRNKEIKKKFDEIVDFSGIGKYIDTPVKRYSSGMYVRLAFAVAAHLDCEILIIDEVLSVGDIEFQKKCLSKLGDVNKEQGKTILFVSHNMNSIRMLCNKGLILEKGQLTYFGDVQNAIHKYTSSIFSQNISKKYLSFLSNECSYLQLQNVVINNQQSGVICLNDGNNSLNFILEGILSIEKNMSFEFILYDKDLMPLLFYSPGHYEGMVKKYPAGAFSIIENIDLPKNINRGEYTASFYLTEPDIKYHIKYDFAVTINIDGFPTKTGQVFDYNNGKGFLFIP